MSVRALRSTFGPLCHWCGLPMDFDEPHGRPESATIEHLLDATMGGVRQPKHRRLAHGACNRMRNELKLEAERRFRQWIETRVAQAGADGDSSTP
jgi:hypothetical protein